MTWTVPWILNHEDSSQKQQTSLESRAMIVVVCRQYWWDMIIALTWWQHFKSVDTCTPNSVSSRAIVAILRANDGTGSFRGVLISISFVFFAINCHADPICLLAQYDQRTQTIDVMARIGHVFVGHICYAQYKEKKQSSHATPIIRLFARAVDDRCNMISLSCVNQPPLKRL